MKTKLALLTLSGSLSFGLSALLAQNANTNSLPLTQTVKYQAALEKDRSLGECSILPPGLKEKMKLTDAQRADLKPIEEDFAKTCGEYQLANQPRIDAALDACRQARQAKNRERIEAARRQLQNAWAGLHSYREAAVNEIKPLLTPDQINILEDAKNQWRESYGDEANDPSAH